MMPNLQDANRPIQWTDQDLCLYHGTETRGAKAIAEGKIALARCKSHTDFGPGFYGTTFYRQATTWARKRAELEPKALPVVVELKIPRGTLAGLQTLAFVDGDYDLAEDFWSFVWHCRSGATNHARHTSPGVQNASYDLVIGPVAIDWRQRMTAPRADQYGFHTETAIELLNNRAGKRIIEL